MINLTPNAISAVEKFIKGSATPVAGLRIAIAGGGCSGFQYGMSLEEAKNDDDTVLEYGAVTLLVDPLVRTVAGRRDSRLRRQPERQRFQIRKPERQLQLRVRFIVLGLRRAPCGITRTKSKNTSFNRATPVRWKVPTASATSARSSAATRCA